MQDISRNYKLKLWGVLALALVLRVPVFIHPHLGMESIHVMYARAEPLMKVVKSAAAFELSPLFYMSFNLWSRISDEKHWIVTLPLLLHMAAIYLLCRFGRKWGGEAAGLTAGFLAAISPYMIHCSVSPRYENYTILLSLISVYCGYEMIRNRGGRGMVAAYVVSTLLGMYTYYYFIYVIVLQNLFFLLSRPRRVGTWILSQLAIVCLFAPWVPYMLRLSHAKTAASSGIVHGIISFFASKAYMNVFDIVVYYTAGMQFSIHEHSAPARTVLIAGLILPAAAAAGAFRARRKKPEVWNKALYLFCITVLGLGVAMFGRIWLGLLLHPKHAVIFISAYMLLIGIGVSAVETRFLKAALFALVIFSAAVSLNNYYPMMLAPNEFEGTMDYIRDHEKSGDVILVMPAYYETAARYYYSGGLQIKGLPRNHGLILNDFGQDWPVERTIAAAKKIGGETEGRIWLLLPRGYKEPRVPAPGVVAALKAAGYGQVLKRGFISDVIPRYDGYVLLLEKKKRDRAVFPR